MSKLSNYLSIAMVYVETQLHFQTHSAHSQMIISHKDVHIGIIVIKQTYINKTRFNNL